MTKNTAQSDDDKAEQPGFYTVKETAQHLRLCEKQIRRLIERGELPAYRLGTALRIKKQAIHRSCWSLRCDLQTWPR
jgi:excisionase family DNA binding protein